MNEILIIDDEISICDSLTFLLEEEYKVYSSQDPISGLDIIENNNINLVLLDLKIGTYNGLDYIHQIKNLNDNIQIIVMTAFGSIQSSVEAIKKGASHYITKPLDFEELLALVENSIKLESMAKKINNLQGIVQSRYGSQNIIGKSPEIKHILDKVNQVKDLDTTVLITGESGTGKDLIAKSLHYDSFRKNENLEIINCAAIPTDLLESELFGYKKGAFTGAIKDKLGKIQLAHKGTLFLDEIGEMNLNLQAKILRVVEDMEISPLGSEQSVKVDVRIIAASNKDLKTEILKGNFREDLFYRLNIINLKLPALRDRTDDIVLLANYFVKKYSTNFDKKVESISPEAINLLKEYLWPGNIRELENIIEQTLVFLKGNVIEVQDLPSNLSLPIRKKNAIVIDLGSSLYEAEKNIILKTLEFNDENRKLTSKMLGISLRTLQYKIKEYSLD